MGAKIEDAVERLVQLGKAWCEQPPAAGLSDSRIANVKKRFAELGFPFPSGLMEVWRHCRGTGKCIYGYSFLKSAVGGQPDEVTECDRIAEYDIERYGYLNLGNGYRCALTMNRDGMVSLEYWAFDVHPKNYPYSFEEGFAKYVELLEAEAAEGVFSEFDDEEDD